MKRDMQWVERKEEVQVPPCQAFRKGRELAHLITKSIPDFPWHQYGQPRCKHESIHAANLSHYCVDTTPMMQPVISKNSKPLLLV